MIEDHYRAIVESAEDPIFIADRDGRYIYGNRRAAANQSLKFLKFVATPKSRPRTN